jgi:hypothetical protein
MTNIEIIHIFEDIFFEENFAETSRLRDPEFYINKSSNDGVNEFETLHVKLFGGMNGWGKSKDYLYDLYKVIDVLNANNVFAYLVKMEIDALDDVFYVDLQLGDLEKLKKEKPE